MPTRSLPTRRDRERCHGKSIVAPRPKSIRAIGWPMIPQDIVGVAAPQARPAECKLRRRVPADLSATPMDTRYASGPLSETMITSHATHGVKPDRTRRPAPTSAGQPRDSSRTHGPQTAIGPTALPPDVMRFALRETRRPPNPAWHAIRAQALAGSATSIQCSQECRWKASCRYSTTQFFRTSSTRRSPAFIHAAALRSEQPGTSNDRIDERTAIGYK